MDTAERNTSVASCRTSPWAGVSAHMGCDRSTHRISGTRADVDFDNALGRGETNGAARLLMTAAPFGFY